MVFQGAKEYYINTRCFLRCLWLMDLPDTPDCVLCFCEEMWDTDWCTYMK